jgi:uncharacterized membrane protein
MEKSRLEAFTDGVYAIAITLLVLDIRLPEGTNAANLGAQLLHVLPSLGTFLLSFVIIGLYWSYHHSASRNFKKIDNRVVWLNFANLLFICLLPFTASLFGKYIFDSWAGVLYGANLILINMTGQTMMWYLSRHANLAIDSYDASQQPTQSRFGRKVNIIYIVAIVLAFFVPQVSIYLYAAMAVYLVSRAIFPQWVRD